MIMKNKVLILTRDLKVHGGVTNFYRIFFKNYNYNDISIQAFKQGISKNQSKRQIVLYIIKYLLDIIRFIYILKKDPSIKIIQLNPSFFNVPIIRDSLYLLISKVFNKKVIIFYHGWNYIFYKKIYSSIFKKKLFYMIYSKADYSYVLSNEFKDNLLNLKINRIEVTKTLFDGCLFKGYKKKKNNKPLLLYSGRMQEKKGILDILDALKGLKEKHYKFSMEFMGWFINKEFEYRFFQNINKYQLNENVFYLGYQTGKNKIINYIQCDIFIFPSYFEGCPTSVIEAMAAGCFIITTDLPALKEIIRNGENGYLFKPGDTKDLINKIEIALNNYNKLSERSKGIKEEAFRKYESRIIIGQIHGTYLDLLRGDLH